MLFILHVRTVLYGKKNRWIYKILEGKSCKGKAHFGFVKYCF